VSETDRYLSAWQEYRRRRRALRVAALLGVVLVVLGSLAPDLRWMQGLGVLAWIVTLVVFFTRVSRWPCPRCGRDFLYRSPSDRGPGQNWYGTWPFAGRCVHCGLPKWAAGST
jgi:hypothetical protein